MIDFIVVVYCDSAVSQISLTRWSCLGRANTVIASYDGCLELALLWCNYNVKGSGGGELMGHSPVI